MILYLDYIKERLGKEHIDCEDGFAIFIPMPLSNAIYIEDIYVRPEARKKHVASDMADEIADIAKKMGFKYLLGTVCPEAKGSTESLKVLLAYGMKLLRIENNLIWFCKEI